MFSLAVVLTGACAGVLVGLFGVGGSSLATPVLALLGVPALAAVASPLAATIPASAVGATLYLRAGEARPRAAAWSLVGGVPAAIVGALLSGEVGGSALLVASGLFLVVAGARMLRPVDDRARDVGERRRRNRPALVAATVGVGFFTGLLANSGGFLLVPLYAVFFGLRMRRAVGTSLLVVSVLSVPTLATHWALGHVDWTVAGLFAFGAIPATVLGTRLSLRLRGPTVRRALGWLLVVFGIVFTTLRLAGTP